jgi:hypothetical protein
MHGHSGGEWTLDSLMMIGGETWRRVILRVRATRDEDGNQGDILARQLARCSALPGCSAKLEAPQLSFGYDIYLQHFDIWEQRLSISSSRGLPPRIRDLGLND